MATPATVTLNELVEPVHIGEVALFNVTDGFGVTVTVAVLVKVELLQPLYVTLEIVVSTDTIDTNVISVLVVNVGVVIVPEVP